MRMNITSTQQVRRIHTIELDEIKLKELLRNAGVPIPGIGVEISVAIPGGGDWSNTDLPITGKTKVTISWVTIDEVTGQSHVEVGESR